MSYPPHEIARADQHYALVEKELDELVAAYRNRRASENRVEVLDRITHALACPHLPDGTKQLAPINHASTLANMLAIAIDRLAQAATA